MSGIKVCLDARILSGSGGIEQCVIGLAHGLSNLDDGEEEYHFLAYENQAHWLEPHLRGPCRLLPTKEMPFDRSLKGRIKAVPGFDSVLNALPPVKGLRRKRPAASDGTPEQAGMDVMHFTTPNAFVTELPSIYQPHDLQYVHLPQFFTRRDREYRDASYRLHCSLAEATIAMTQWGKTDLELQFGMDPSSIRVIPWAPLLGAYEDLTDTEAGNFVLEARLPNRFLYFPATTYEHKNHIGLLRALHTVGRDSDPDLHLVCTGRVTEHLARIKREAERLGLGDRVHFLGFVPERTVKFLYRQAHALVFPSTFEGWGLPVCEAFWAGLPVACSNVTCLPEVAGGAALLFDPYEIDEIAGALASIVTDEETRQQLIRRGKERSAQWSWEATARKFRALYRQITGQPLSDQDKNWLDETLPAT
jgi:glycosyltransferase involved in cell wall biosynthesis